MSEIILDKQDLTHLNWSHVRSSSGTAGTFLKSESSLGGTKIYYKLSNFNPVSGIVGHECINEIIVDRLLTVLGVDHLDYQLIHADIEIDGNVYETYVCASQDFKKRGENKVALDDYYRINKLPSETPYDFCTRMGWQRYIDQMIAVDYLICNRDRHGANIEVLRNARAKTYRIAPLFDHGLSLMYSCTTKEDIDKFDVLEDRRCNNFIGGFSCCDNLSLIKDSKSIFTNTLLESDKAVIFENLDHIISDEFIDKAWSMIYERYQIYENI